MNNAESERPEQYLKADLLETGEPSVCGSCGETFGCGAKLDGCWCTELTLSEVAAAEVANGFDGCLCQRCLSAFAKLSELKANVNST